MTRFGQKATAPIGDKGLVADLALDSGVECRVHLDNELNLSSLPGPLAPKLLDCLRQRHWLPVAWPCRNYRQQEF